MPFAGPDTITDAKGEFRLPPAPTTRFPSAQAARLQIRLARWIGARGRRPAGPRWNHDGQAADPAQSAQVRGPQRRPPGRAGRCRRRPGGKPIEGVEVDAWTWYPGNETKTDASGFFRMGKLDKDRKVEVQFRKPGYTPQLFLTQPTGRRGWVVVLGEQDLLRRQGHGPRRTSRSRTPDPGQ